MKKPSELDIAQLKFEMRTMYADIGFEESLQVFYELLVSANLLAEVIMEERSSNG